MQSLLRVTKCLRAAVDLFSEINKDLSPNYPKIPPPPPHTHKISFNLIRFRVPGRIFGLILLNLLLQRDLIPEAFPLQIEGGGGRGGGVGMVRGAPPDLQGREALLKRLVASLTETQETLFKRGKGWEHKRKKLISHQVYQLCSYPTFIMTFLSIK